MVAYADLVLPDTTYLARHDVMSMLDRPISEFDGPVDSVRIPVLPPTGECKPFQEVLIELGTRLKLPVFVKKDGTRPVPMHLRNAPTKLMQSLDYGKGYRYAHDEEGGFAAGERYWPDGMAAPAFYQPVERGLEIRIAEKMRQLKARNAAAVSPPPETNR